jgi:Mn2+/Fe2+ NRAMP family transporter
LLAATGVGGGDLATGTFVGSLLGTAVLWAVVLGAFLKFVVTEGLARWQLVTGDTFLEGLVHTMGPPILWVFLPYLLLWSFFVGSAQMSACGVALYALFPVFENPDQGKIVFGMVTSIVGIGLVIKGGYRLFEQIMRICIAIMFVIVVVTAVVLWPGTDVVLQGLFMPTIPDFDGLGLTWTVALIGGVGGTLTVLCYGYWLREDGRVSSDDIWACRVDLGAGYAMTAIFGIAMVIIGSNVEIEGQGTTLLVTLSERLEEPLGVWGKWLFLIGAFGAVFSSLLGVWQSVPYLFADCWRLLFLEPTNVGETFKKEKATRIERVNSKAPVMVDTSGLPYRSFLVILGVVPMVGLFWGFQQVQKLYTVTGALFFPFLALALLIWNGRSDWVGVQFKNRPITAIALIGILLFFSSLGVRTIFGIY